MAGIDHTCIYFHNGMLMKEIEHCDWIERNTAWETGDGKVHTTNEIVGTTNEVYLLPFYTTRDGLFTKDNAVKIEDMNRIFPDVWFDGNKRKEARVIKAWDKNSWKTEEKYPKLDFENRVYWYKDLNKLIITQHTEDYCLTFYFKLDTKDSLDYCIPETIEEDEEHVMGTEHTKYYKALADMLRFKHYWSMINTDEEREKYLNTVLMKYDPDSLFPESETIKEEPSEEFKRLVDSL